MKRQGFTLVELSIVLVIIGLLIGGILVAQSMITTAKINKNISILTQIDIASSNFITKYNQIPGDSGLFPLGGDNNGLLEGGNEMNSFWVHLSLGVDFKNQAGTDYEYPAIAGTIKNCPKLELVNPAENNCLIAPTANDYVPPRNNMRNNGFNQFLPSTAYAIDLKLDDGLPLSGRIVAPWGNCTVNSVYNIASTSYSSCFLVLYPGFKTGTEF